MSRTVSITILSIFIAISYAQEPRTSLDDLIKNVFNTNNDNQPNLPIQPDLPNLNPIDPNQPFPSKTTVLTPTPPVSSTYKSCGIEKECVPRYLCKNGKIVADGTDVIDIRLGTDCQYLEVCCDIPNKTTKPIQPPVPKVQHEGCGYQNPDGVGFRITGDKNSESQFGEFPWMVAILREEAISDDIINLYECGGALLTPTVVLTAAHCVQNRLANTLVVRAGEWDTQTKTEVLPHQDQRVKEIIVHEKYNKGALFNDIALLIMDSPFVWEENVRPICLPESNANFDHARCYATGWGKDKFETSGTYQVILKKIDLPVMPRSECQANLRNTRLGLYFELNESFICAGGEKDKDTCKGDGGSPLVCPIPGQRNRFYQAGIVAWGIGCGEENIPGVYANVPYLRQWINEKLHARNIDFTHFTP